MKFSEIVDHLAKRGFVTRDKTPEVIYFWGMDNSSKISWVLGDERRHGEWNISVADIKGEDWKPINLFWDGTKDNFLPFDEGKI